MAHYLRVFRCGYVVQMRKVVDWDSGVYLGLIPEAPQTYNVIGNVNEHGLAITETTFGG